MKKIITLTALSLLTVNAWALDEVLGDSDEYYQSPLLDHSRGEVVTPAHIQVGDGENYGSMLIPQPADHTHSIESDGDFIYGGSELPRVEDWN